MEQRRDPPKGKKSAVKSVCLVQRAAADGELRVVKELPSGIWHHLLFSSLNQKKRAKSQAMSAENVTVHVAYLLYSVIYFFLIIEKDPWQRSRDV